MKKLLLVLSSLVLSSCATMFSGSRQEIVFESNVKNVDVLTVDNIKYRDVKFPCVVSVQKGFDKTVVHAEKTGTKSDVTLINKRIDETTFLNILSGGIIGLGIDTATGAMMKSEYDNYMVYFPILPEETNLKSDTTSLVKLDKASVVIKQDTKQDSVANVQVQ